MRQEMQLELKQMHRELGITFVFVTHDQEEALTMSDKIVVMSHGKLQQIGTPEDIYDSPVNAFVADFIGESNIFNGKKMTDDTVAFAGAEFACQDRYPKDTAVDVMIRPENMLLTNPEGAKLTGEVISSIFKGKYYDVTVLSGKNEIISQQTDGVKVGTTVGIEIKPEGIHNMPSNLKVNHFTGILDEKMRLGLFDGNVELNMEPIMKGCRIENGILYDAKNNHYPLDKIQIEISFLTKDADLSDNPQEGRFTGHIDAFVYKGDHYSYRVRGENNEDYYSNDEWLWNLGDFVSIVVPDDKISSQICDREE
jgi:spermidine/putrescine transport system ATP-binding protein